MGGDKYVTKRQSLKQVRESLREELTEWASYHKANFPERISSVIFIPLLLSSAIIRP